GQRGIADEREAALGKPGQQADRRRVVEVEMIPEQACDQNLSQILRIHAGTAAQHAYTRPDRSLRALQGIDLAPAQAEPATIHLELEALAAVTETAQPAETPLPQQAGQQVDKAGAAQAPRHVTRDDVVLEVAGIAFAHPIHRAGPGRNAVPA